MVASFVELEIHKVKESLIKKKKKPELSNKDIADLSDAQFKTLVIRMLTELVEYGRKTGKSEGYEKENKGKCTGNQQ